ncbi:ABC transporter permease subunit [Clostridium sediminicola]|uniref:ABC transporter permease subunit n=1 Tax=Clostridium sediminicola TaxID=3114879 RepID=UPI0031F203B4
MNIFLREMKANRKALIIWCVSVFLLVAMGMVKYAGLAESGDAINEMMNQLPKGMKAVFGLGTLNLTEVSGYYGMFFLYFLLMGTTHAAMLGANIISKEERDKTVEFLLVKPSNRNKIITAKLLAALVNVIIFNISTLISSIIFVGIHNKGESINKEIVLLMVAMFILQLIFLAIGSTMAAISRRPKTAASAATGIMLITFLISVAIDMNDKLDKLKYFTPFKYFKAADLMFGYGFDRFFVVLSATIIVMFIGITYVFYNKRDLYV